MGLQADNVDIQGTGNLNWPDRNRRIYIDPTTSYLILEATGLNNLYIGAGQETRINKIQVGQFIEGYYTDLRIRQSGGLPNLKIVFQTPAGANFASYDTVGTHRLISPTYGGGFSRKKYEAEVDLSSSTTAQVDIPSGAKIIGVAWVIKTAISITGGTGQWSAAYTAGAGSQSITSAQVVAKDTKGSAFFNPNANSPITSSETDIDLTADGGGTFTAGEVAFVVLVETITNLDSFA